MTVVPGDASVAAASIADVWRLPHLGYAARPDLPRFGLDVWNGRRT